MQKPKLDYFKLISTPRGILQHSVGPKLEPRYGYAVDDNARALVAADLLYSSGDSSMKRYIKIYLNNIADSQAKDGKFYCHLYDDGRKTQAGLGDWFGRSLVALAFHLTQGPALQSPTFYEIKSRTLRSMRLVLKHPELFSSLRTRSQLILALVYLLDTKKDTAILKCREDSRIREILKVWEKDFETSYKQHVERDWIWPEDKITYDNGKIIQAYFLLGEILNNNGLIKMGKSALDWYYEATTRHGYFQSPGTNNDKFWEKGQKLPTSLEQPLEACSLVAALVTAGLVNKVDYLREQMLVYEWFYGKNRLNMSLVDKRGAVRDSLNYMDCSPNCGAENVVSINLAYFAIKEGLHL